MRRKGILARGAFEPSSRKPEQLPWVLWALGALLIYLIMPIGALSALGVSGDLESAQQGDLTLRSNGLILIGSAIAGTGLAIVLLASTVPKRPDLGFRLQRTDPLWGLAATAAALPIILLVNITAAAVHQKLTGIEPDPLAHETLRLMSEGRGSFWWWVTVVGVVIAVPIAEELLYRGFLQSSLVALTKSRWAAIGVTSILFALAHQGAADLRALPGLLVLSIALGIAFERKARIGVPIAMHAIFNLFNILLSL